MGRRATILICSSRERGRRRTRGEWG